MNTLSACPAPASLQDYLLGRVSEVTAVAVETHLASCPNCRKLLPTIQAEDDFVVDFRAQAGRPQPKNAVLDRLAGDLRGFLGGLPTGHEATPPADAVATPAPAGRPTDADEDVRSLLAPPRQPDELGRLGDYRVLKVLGSGGMGVVFLAEDTRLRRRVALKAMRPALAANSRARQRFLREAQLTASITHDHVIAVHQVGEQNGVPFLAMPLLQGESLDARLKREGRLPLAEVLQIGRETAEGLAAAHEHGLIHRDVKPANLWLESRPSEPGGLSPRYRVKILDFGLARSGEGEGAHLTQTGVVVGTPAYMAPEQARGEKVDVRGDLFSLGCVLYKLCTGATPFAGDSAMAILMALAIRHPKPARELNPDVPAELSDLVMRLLEKDPTRRPQSAGEVILVLQAIDLAPAKRADRDARPTTAAGGRKRLPWALAAVAGGSLALSAVATFIIIRYTNKDGKPVEIKVVAPEGAHDLEVAIKPDDAPNPTPAKAPKPAMADDAWLKQVAALPPAKQMEAVVAKLKELNPGFGGKVKFKIDRGEVEELRIEDDHVADLSPLRALDRLKRLFCPGTAPGKGSLTDLTPLRGASLEFLEVSGTAVEDLRPLSGMKLKYLGIDYTPVTDLSPLKGAPLTRLHCSGTKVNNLSPLKGMPLTELSCGMTQVSDLSPLRDMPLTYLDCGATGVADLSPLKAMKLTFLGCCFTSVSDLSPLKGMPLTQLYVYDTEVSDLSPLKGMPLTDLFCNDNRLVTDLSPLQGMPLQRLLCNDTKASDLSPLKGMPLRELRCDFVPERDTAILRSIPTLEKINDQPSKQLLK